MSLLSGDYRLVEPDGLDMQMEIERTVFTELHQQILLWSSTQFFVYDVGGRLVHRERIDHTHPNKVDGFTRSECLSAAV